jgi:nitroreductase
MEFWDVIESRHSTRDFLPKPVPREVVERLLRAAAMAPSAHNSQPWRYHVATGTARTEIGMIVAQATVYLEEYMAQLGPERFEHAVQWYSSLGNAPMIIGVSAPDLDKETELDQLNQMLAVGASVENLMLAATAEGLAACNITFAWWVRDDLARYFDIGDDRKMVAIIALGYPTSEPPVAPVTNEDIADWLE